MGMFHSNASWERHIVVREDSLIDEDFDDSMDVMDVHEYERTLLAATQPHHFTPSSRQ